MVRYPDMPRSADLPGMHYGNLSFLYVLPGGRLSAQCDCGTITVVRRYNVRSGNTSSCGCQQMVNAHAATRGNPDHGNFKHGLYHHPLYSVWSGIIQRCTNQKNAFYKDYGGRGITVCDRWRSPEHFIRDMEKTYQPGLSIDRIDNDGDYEPDNCRWATQKVQQNNKRNSRHLAPHTPRPRVSRIGFRYRGVYRTLPEWAEVTGIQASTLSSRLRSGWPVKDVVTFKSGQYRAASWAHNKVTGQKRRLLIARDN